jgi:hypothetical protein
VRPPSPLVTSRRRNLWDEDDEGVVAVHGEMVRAGFFATVDPGPDEAAWRDCELASFAENRLGDDADPREISDDRRTLWAARATTEALSLPSQRSWDRCYWLVEDGRRIGTIALASSLLGGLRVRVGSLYVYPPERGRSVVRRVLGELRAALGRQGLGLRLSTSWTWQRPLRLYLRMGMWVRMWKHDLDLFWDARSPAPEIAFTGDRATLSVTIEGETQLLAEARREGDRLDFFDESVRRSDVAGLRFDAASTLALALALEGWPLIRSAEEWQQSYWADGGPPEALAYKITLWEAWCGKHGWRVETPRIPGLEYPTWSELEARWDAWQKEYDARNSAHQVKEEETDPPDARQAASGESARAEDAADATAGERSDAGRPSGE